MVKTRTLILVAAVVWLLAGANIVWIGVQAYAETGAPAPMHTLLILGTLGIFALFYLRIFKPYARKHIARVLALPDERIGVWRFMDAKGYLIMGFMMGLGIGLRVSGIVPSWFIAFFYVGLGSALVLTGLDMISGYRTGEVI